MKLKKQAAAIFSIIALITCLTGCGSGGKATTEKYVSDSGISITMESGLKAFEAEGSACAYEGKTCVVNSIREGFELFTPYGYDAQSMAIEEYSVFVENANSFIEPFSKNEDGNLFITYEKDVNGTDVFYYTTLRKGSDAFWVVNFACPTEKKQEYQPVFETWAKTIEVN